VKNLITEGHETTVQSDKAKLDGRQITSG